MGQSGTDFSSLGNPRPNQHHSEEEREKRERKTKSNYSTITVQVVNMNAAFENPRQRPFAFCVLSVAS